MSRSGFIVSAALAAAIPLLAACSGGGDTAEPGGADPTATPAVEPAAPPSGPVDEALAERGEELFQSKGCIACHTIGKGRLTGPDLAGVGERRDWPWIVHMVTNPDSMLRSDPIAEGLMAEYMTPMPHLGVTPDEVRAIYEHIRHESAEAAEDAEDDEDDENDPSS